MMFFQILGNICGFLVFKKIDLTEGTVTDYDNDFIPKIYGRSIWPVWLLIITFMMLIYLKLDNAFETMLLFGEFLRFVYVSFLFSVALWGLMFPFETIIKSIINITKAFFGRMCIIRDI